MRLVRPILLILTAVVLLAVSALPVTALPVTALDRWVTIVNSTDFTIVRFYGSNQGSDSWEEDILGEDILAPNSQVNVNFEDGTGYCNFDFRAEFDDGEVLVKNDVNVCKIDTFTYK